jgi:hypothetical protein
VTPPWPGPAYTGPPPTVPPPTVLPPYGSYVPVPYPVYPPGPWGPWTPPRPTRPPGVVTGAVLAFVQAGLVVFASVYLLFFASLAALEGGSSSSGEPDPAALATEAQVLAVVQLLSAVFLVVAGVLVLARGGRVAWWLLVAAHGLQVLLAVYWAVRLLTLADQIAGPDPIGGFVAGTLFFAAGPAVAVALALPPSVRRWAGVARA